MFLIQAVSILACLPSHMVVMIFCCIIIDNAIVGWLFVYLSAIFIGVFIYFYAIRWFKCIKQKVTQYELFEQIKLVLKEDSLKNCILLKFSFIPSGFKYYLLSSMEVSFFDYEISDIITTMLYATEACLISTQFRKF